MLSFFCPKLKRLHKLPAEADGSIVKHEQTVFHNWGDTVKNTPAYLFYPRSIQGISHIITWAKRMGKTVRVAAYRHSWSHLFSDDNQVLISLLDKREVNSLPAIHKIIDQSNPFQFINLVGNAFEEDGKIKHLCKIGAATTNEQFRQWVINSFNTYGSKSSWTVPVNVVMVETTFGGSNAVACHGAGINNRTLSDLVTEIEFVNPYGKLQKIGYKTTDTLEQQMEGRELIKTASACFGMLGIVTSLTIKLDQLTHARMKPEKPRLALAVPPPQNYVISDSIPADVFQDLKPADFKKAEENFINHCENDYYAEWFWFSLHDKCWVNTWKNDGLESESKDFPSLFTTKIQEIEEYLGELSNRSVMKILPAKLQATLLSDVAMLSLPAEKEVTMPLIDGLHFQRGIRNMQAKDMEFEIPIPALPDGKPDFSICQRAWWDAISTVYEWMEKKGKVPMRLPLEMRILNGSDVTMAPQHGNQTGTCAIEVLTIGNDLVNANEWHAFMQDILDKWSKYTDFSGKPLNIRPHWAKQWEGLKIQRAGEDSKNIIDYLRDVAYKDQISVYKKHLSIIAKRGGYTLNDLKIFSNPLLDKIFYSKKNETKLAPRRQIMSSNSSDEEPVFNQTEIAKVKNLMFKTKLAHNAQQNYLLNQLGEHEIPIQLKAEEPSKMASANESKNLINLFYREVKAEQEKLEVLEEKLKNS